MPSFDTIKQTQSEEVLTFNSIWELIPTAHLVSNVLHELGIELIQQEFLEVKAMVTEYYKQIRAIQELTDGEIMPEFAILERMGEKLLKRCAMEEQRIEKLIQLNAKIDQLILLDKTISRIELILTKTN